MCAGIKRHEAEEEEALQARSSDPLGLKSCATTVRDGPLTCRYCATRSGMTYFTRNEVLVIRVGNNTR